MDECVRTGVVKVFAARGHEIRYVTKELGQQTPDELVAQAADDSELILVTCNYKHLKALIARRPATNKQAFRYAGLISFEQCKDSRTDSRAAQAIEYIEFEYGMASTRKDRRIIFGIFPGELRIYY